MKIRRASGLEQAYEYLTVYDAVFITDEIVIFSNEDNLMMAQVEVGGYAYGDFEGYPALVVSPSDYSRLEAL